MAFISPGIILFSSVKNAKFRQSNSQPGHISNYVYRYYEHCAKKKENTHNVAIKKWYVQNLN